MDTDKKIKPFEVNGDKEYRENSVQEILNDSLNKHCDQSSLFLRLHPPVPLIPQNGSISILTDHLILTSAANVIPNIIDALSITCVVSAASELPDVPLGNEVTYHKVDIMDSPNSDISIFLDATADLIDQVASLGGRTLVFCVAGVSRSASICIAYLMKHHQLTLLEAYNYVKIRRSRVKPNCGFFKQLIEYEKKIFIKSTVQMVFNEFVQMSIPDVYDSEYRVVRNIEKKFRKRN